MNSASNKWDDAHDEQFSIYQVFKPYEINCCFFCKEKQQVSRKKQKLSRTCLFCKIQSYGKMVPVYGPLWRHLLSIKALSTPKALGGTLSTITEWQKICYVSPFHFVQKKKPLAVWKRRPDKVKGILYKAILWFGYEYTFRGFNGRNLLLYKPNNISEIKRHGSHRRSWARFNFIITNNTLQHFAE